MDWLVQHPTDQYTHASKSAGNTLIHACVFFLSHLRVFSAHYFVKLPPFRNSYPGSHGTPSSLPHYRACLRFNSEKKKCSELSFLPWRPLASNWCAFMQPTSIIRSTQAARRFLRSVCILMLTWYVSGLDLDPNEHTSYLMILYLTYIA